MSGDLEELIVVDESDCEIRPLSKSICHDGNGTRHRAFSLFVFDEKGRTLIQQRSKHKRLWPGFWSNSCCSHPRWGEDLESAAVRRSREELGLELHHLKFVYQFEYQAPFEDLGSEWEICHVFLARTTQAVVVNPSEIAAYQWVEADALQRLIDHNPQDFTPWFKMEWAHLVAMDDSSLDAFRLPSGVTRHSH